MRYLKKICNVLNIKYRVDKDYELEISNIIKDYNKSNIYKNNIINIKCYNIKNILIIKVKVLSVELILNDKYLNFTKYVNNRIKDNYKLEIKEI